ncbi:MAG: hypothetical protein QXH03_05025 [Candidatus Bathyarchaeia archaeon]
MRVEVELKRPCPGCGCRKAVRDGLTGEVCCGQCEPVFGLQCLSWRGYVYQRDGSLRVWNLRDYAIFISVLNN